MAKQAASVKVTGGGGFNYEDHVAARLLVDMLGGIAPFGPGFGHIARLDWQARDTGRLLDDVRVSLDAPDGQHIAEFSIKSHRQVSTAGFPANFVAAAWEQWLRTVTTSFDRYRDLLVLVTGEIANDVTEAWHALLRESRLSTPDRMLNRLGKSTSPDAGSQSSEIVRVLFSSFQFPSALVSSEPVDDSVTIELIKRVRLLHFDFEHDPSQDESRAIADCQRLLRSGDHTEAHILWGKLLQVAAEHRIGGALDLAGLLARLQSSFDLVDHPDYRADWQALERASRDVLDDVRTQIGGGLTLDRGPEIETLSSELAAKGICFAVGESGCGKSGLAKTLGTRHYAATIAMSPDLLDVGGAGALEQHLGLRHSLHDVLSVGRESCLLLFDSMEKCSERGLRLAARIISELLESERCRHVHVLIVIQLDTAHRVVAQLAEAGLDYAKLEVKPIGSPPEVDILNLLSDVAGIPWATLHRDIRPLLRNLKIVDWAVHAARTGARLDASAASGLVSLIDYLWDRWVEAGALGLARGGLLKRLAVSEAATLKSGVPLVELEHAEHLSLPELLSSDLLKRRNERVAFAHDLLGDWARLKVLIGESPTHSSDALQRSATPRWHRAVRLFGRWLLAHVDGLKKWSRALVQADDGTTDGTIVHDLLLESVILSENSEQLINLAWPVLTESGGRLLIRLLDRFLFIATVPDVRVSRVGRNESVSPQIEAAFRVPLWPYWKAVLRALDDHVEDICRLAPAVAARICHIWLEKTATELAPGTPFPWRAEAAHVALCVAREMQAQHAEGRYISDRQDRVAYEAALLGAYELPDAIAAFALEMACRRPRSQEVQQRAEAARRVAEAASRRRDAEDPNLARQRRRLLRSPFPLGPVREPWPDGPTDRVESAFRDAVLNSTALVSLAGVRPDTALEVLLAVCIEPPGHEDIFVTSGPPEDYGLEHWHEGYPAMYFRGPFLPFIRKCPAQGVDFVIRLINFATARWSEAEARYRAHRGLPPFPHLEDEAISVAVPIGSEGNQWAGDRRVFRWHLDWPVESKLITCSLMALEKWLYELIDSGDDIENWLLQITQRSESVAFAGLLIDVGKRQPRYYFGALRPLLGNPIFYLWESVIQAEQRGMSPGLVAWWNQPPELTALAREWHAALHRRQMLLQVAISLTLSSDEMQAYFRELTNGWRGSLDADGQPRALQVLVEQLDRRNYRVDSLDTGELRIEFVPPAAMLAEIEGEQTAAEDSLRLLTFPIDCRRMLDGEMPLSAGALPDFWHKMRAIADQLEDAEGYRSNAIAGGIAVLLRRHYEWLDAEPERMAWCLSELHRIASQPHPRRQFDFPETTGDWGWDCFLAEAGVCLLSRHVNVAVARQLVAIGVAAYHYGTTAKTMRLAYEFRQQISDDFEQMQHLAIRWSVVRRLLGDCEQYLSDLKTMRPFSEASGDTDAKIAQLAAAWKSQQCEHIRLVENFVNGSTLPITLEEAGATGAADAERLALIRFPERPPRSVKKDATSSRRKARRQDPGVDWQVLKAALGWLDLLPAGAEGKRGATLDHVRGLLQLALNTLLAGTDVESEDADDDEIDGLPGDSDAWVFGNVARAVVHARDDEEAESLWRPILSLGLRAHQWIERFFWEWFTVGVHSSPSPETFARRWSQMIEFALALPSWNPTIARSHHLDDVVFELLGYHFGVSSIAKNDQYAPVLATMIPILDAAAQQWFSLPRVANGFARSLPEPAYDQLLCPGIRWLRRAMPQGDDYYFWRESEIESNLISALSRSWERHYHTVATDSELQAAFLDILAKLASRGNHGAMALRERVVDSIPRIGM